jgi:hypothetical protein
MAIQFDAMLSQYLAQVEGLPDLDYRAILSVGSHQIEALRVIAKTERENYLNSMFEEILISLVFEPSAYTEIILHGHEDMSLTLITKSYGTNLSKKRTYRAVLVENRNVKLEGNVQSVDEVQLADKQSLSVVNFQLIDPAAYNLRLQEVGGIFKNANTMSTLKYFLSKIRLVDDFAKQSSVAAITADSTYQVKAFQQLVIPDGTKLQALPDFLQRRYGVFNQGIGCFLKNRCWYIFAPYSIAKATADVDKLVLLNVPPSKYRNLERNFVTKGRTYTILCTGETRHQKRSDTDALNLGTGVRYADSTQLLSGMTDKSSSPKLTPKGYMTEYRSSNYKNDYDHTPMAGMIDNPAWYASQLAARGGEIMTVTWERGTTDILTPGMPVQFITPYNDGIKQLSGTLIGVEAFSQVPLGGMVETRHTTQVVLTLFLKKG